MVFKILFLTLFISQTLSHVPRNDSNVFITYAGHADAERPAQRPRETNTTTSDAILTTSPDTTDYLIDEPKEDVVFIPNERDKQRDTDKEKVHADLKLQDVYNRPNKKTLADIMAGKPMGRTDPPQSDILFIAGKNDDSKEKSNLKEPKRRWDDRAGYFRVDIITTDKPKIIFDCKHLDCNNTIQSVCGGKIESNRWKHRLFRNECYFRKVNCDLKYEVNRYKKVPLQKCKNIGEHFLKRPGYHQAAAPSTLRQDMKDLENLRRNFNSGRRSMFVNSDGQRCAHACPAACTQDYEPECALSAVGERRVFLNHCRLDHDSCTNNMVWHRRALAECVGGKKADIRENRAFIGWMQKVGIVDSKGRLHDLN